MNNSSARANGFSQYLKVSFADWLVLKEVVRMPQRFIADVTLKRLWSAPSWWLWWRGYLHTVWVIISVVVDDTVPDNLLTTDTALLLTSLTWWWQRLCLEHLDFLLSNWFIVIHIMVWRLNLEYKSPWNTWRSTLDHPWHGICHQASFWNGNRARNV